ncbi:MAG: DeoR/GlpR transcriptional regulator [Oscillospiraceae bacterium]|nr:DeoR/GlpR transcriptional regulator [Oscillospiraceae bacterium]
MKSSREIIDLRHKNILQLLQKKQTASVAELSNRFNVTTATIRRDLEILEKLGSIKRYFGGVQYILPPNVDVHYRTEKGNPTPAKIAIAKKAASMICPADTVFLNSSSTALLILDYLSDIHASIITNNARALYCEYPESVDLLLTGGEVYGNKQSLVGEFAISSIKKVTAGICFMGASGVSSVGGVTSSIVQEVNVNQSMISQCSGPKIVVADSSKIGVRQSFFSYGLEQVTHLITDSAADKRELELISNCGVEIIVVDV